MIVARQVIERCARGLLALMVAITLLAAPIAGAAAMPCEKQAAEIAHSEKAHDAHRPGDNHGTHQKICCSSLCTWCNLILPAPEFATRPMARDGERLFDRQPAISGLATPPALGPPRPLV